MPKLNICALGCRLSPKRPVFGFPSDAEMCTKWLENIKATKVESSKGLCSRHFENKSIGLRKLLKGTVPTLELGHDEKPKHLSTEHIHESYYKCSVPNCGSKSSETKVFRSPSCKLKRMKWLKAINAMHKTNINVCIKHFEEKYVSQNHLTVDAVPSINLGTEVYMEIPVNENDDDSDGFEDELPVNERLQIVSITAKRINDQEDTDETETCSIKKQKICDNTVEESKSEIIKALRNENKKLKELLDGAATENKILYRNLEILLTKVNRLKQRIAIQDKNIAQSSKQETANSVQIIEATEPVLDPNVVAKIEKTLLKLGSGEDNSAMFGSVYVQRKETSNEDTDSLNSNSFEFNDFSF